MTLWSRGIRRLCDKLKSLYLVPIQVPMATKLGRMGTWDLPWGASNHKVTWCFDYMVWRYHVTNWNHYISTTTVLVATKHGRMITHLDGLLFIKYLDHLILWSSEVTWPSKTIISTMAVPMTTKLDRMQTYLEWLPPIKLLDSLVTFSCKIVKN